jgi:hypothetical protein
MLSQTPRSNPPLPLLCRRHRQHTPRPRGRHISPRRHGRHDRGGGTKRTWQILRQVRRLTRQWRASSRTIRLRVDGTAAAF